LLLYYTIMCNAMILSVRSPMTDEPIRPPRPHENLSLLFLYLLPIPVNSKASKNIQSLVIISARKFMQVTYNITRHVHILILPTMIVIFWWSDWKLLNYNTFIIKLWLLKRKKRYYVEHWLFRRFYSFRTN